MSKLLYIRYGSPGKNTVAVRGLHVVVEVTRTHIYINSMFNPRLCTFNQSVRCGY